MKLVSDISKFSLFLFRVNKCKCNIIYYMLPGQMNLHQSNLFNILFAFRCLKLMDPLCCFGLP